MTRHGPVFVEIEQRDEVSVLRFKGHLSTGADQEYLATRTDEIRRLNWQMVLADFTEVSSVGSTGLSFLVGMYVSVTRNSGGRFVLVGTQPRVREVLDITRLSEVIPMAADLESGLAEIRCRRG